MMVGYIAWTVIHEDGIALTAYPVMIWQAHKQSPLQLDFQDVSLRLLCGIRCVVAIGVQVKCVRIFQEWEGVATPAAQTRKDY